MSIERDTKANLVRGLHKWDLVALVINSIIGAGIFGLPSKAFALAGTYSLLAYLVSAVAICLVILCFAEVGSRFAATGGPYLYARKTFGALVGFQVGWLMWLGRIAAFASLSNLFVGYFAYFVPAAGASFWRAIVIVTVVSALAITNIIGVRATATVTNVLTVGKLIPLLLLALVGLFFVDPERYSLATPPGYSAFSQAALLLVFTYMGFEGAAIPSGEMRDPAKHLPFALLLGLGVVVLVYVSIQTVCIGTLPNLANSERPLSDAGLRLFGAPGATVIAVGAMVSIGGGLNALMFATPRLPFAMAENRQLPQMFSATHRRFGTPIAAIVLTAVVDAHARLVQHVHLRTDDERGGQTNGLHDHMRGTPRAAAKSQRTAPPIPGACGDCRLSHRGHLVPVAPLEQSVERDASRGHRSLAWVRSLCAYARGARDVRPVASALAP